MKKGLALILLFSVFVLLLSGCGGKAGEPVNGEDTAVTAENDTEAADEGLEEVSEDLSEDSSEDASEDASGGNTDGIYQEKGYELTDFLNSVTETEKLFDDAITNIGGELPSGPMMDRVIPNTAMLSMPSYDLLDPEDLRKEEGELMLGGYKGIRGKSGNRITFSGQREYTEDQTFFYKKGDVFSENGSLDISDNTLSYECKTEREGSVVERTVLEVVILKDGTYLLQYLSVTPSQNGDGNYGAAVFKRFNRNEYSAITAEMNSDTAFTYDPIAGRGDIKPEDMAKNCTVTGKFTVTGGKAAFVK